MSESRVAIPVSNKTKTCIREIAANRSKIQPPSSKILFASALDAAKELTSILPDIEFQDIIKKPVDRENFIKVIKMALGV